MCIKLALNRKDYGHLKPILDRCKYGNVYTVLTLKCVLQKKKFRNTKVDFSIQNILEAKINVLHLISWDS